LRGTPEYEQVVQPLAAEIRAVYAKFLLREPTPADVSRHVGHFRALHRAPEECARAMGGNVRKDLGIRPLKLEIDITNQCNLRCVMCYFSDERVFRRRREDISVAEFARIAEQVFPLCHEVSLSFGTESLLHRQFGELIAITKSYGVPLVWTTTNGALLKGTVIDQVVGVGLDLICISVDAATKQTHERIRVGSNFEKLMDNIRALNRAKEQARSCRPCIQLNCVLMRSNIEELPALVQLAHEVKATAVGAVHVTRFDNAAAKEESLVGHKDLCNRMLDEARALALRYKIAAAFPENFAEGPGPSLSPRGNSFYGLRMDQGETSLSCCRFPWHFVGIDPYGNVYPCGWWNGEEPMGNIKKEPFEEIWNNERYRALRAEHLSRALRSNCRSCPAAGLGSVNHNSSFLVKTPMRGYSPGRP
jgi:radical SAM protein with 4Fe4S-binding SPASM domain